MAVLEGIPSNCLGNTVVLQVQLVSCCVCVCLFFCFLLKIHYTSRKAT